MEEELRFEVKDATKAGSDVYSYSLEGTVPKEKLEGLDFLTLIRLDDGEDVVLESARINGDGALAQLGHTAEGKQAIRLALLGYESEDLKIQILVNSNTPVSAQEWRLATAVEADSADFSIDDDVVRDLSRDTQTPDLGPMYEHIPEFKGSTIQYIGGGHNFELIEAVPEEDDGRVAIMRFTFKLDNIRNGSGPFRELQFNPRGWFNLQQGARLDGVGLLWHNNTTNDDASLSATNQKSWAGIDLVKHRWVTTGAKCAV
ncbi:hypothetical protein [Corynebacterium pilosum]|uniref:Uncharacterized protein n=1 Tax=Corynebacterium pilosum TaxID=35756 RepID=A0A376CMN2_9CORY|nr:hypothetical protein [Corynebacterium pilosum]STC68928.1 Uncharacterised protein [Corynebacterium pilosum]